MAEKEPHIGIFSDSFLPIVDGVGRVAFGYAKTLGDMGYVCYVFAPMNEMGYVGNYPFEVINYSTAKLPGKLPYRIGLPDMDLHFDRASRAAQLDIVHAHTPFMTGRFALRVAKRHGLPLVGTFHSKYYDDFLQATHSKLLALGGAKIVVDFYEQCDEVWCVSEATGETLRSYGYRGAWRVMPNGVERRTLDVSALPEVKARYGIKDDVPVLLFVGQMNWKKNILLVLEAARQLKEEGKRFQLVLAGQGPHREEIAARAAALGLSNLITFTGHISNTRELDALYALSTLLVFPSLYDSASMVQREAATMGTPCVLIAGSSTAECVRDGYDALTCENTTEGLSRVISGALEDPDRLGRIGETASRTMAIDWHVRMEEVLEYYRALIYNARKKRSDA